MTSKEELIRQHGAFGSQCRKCGVVKNKMKFKRFNSFSQICNDCFLEKREKDYVECS